MGAPENFDQFSNSHSSICSSQSINDEDESHASSTDSDDQKMDLTIIQPITNISKQKPSSFDQHMYKVAKIDYDNVEISIFMDINQPRRFFFEPIVQLDTTSISIESSSDKLVKEKLVRIEILMWTEELRSKVLDHLRSLRSLSNSSNIQLDDISVMPFEDLKLVKESDYIINNKSIRLAKKVTSYEKMSESVLFYFRCDSMDSASFLADSLCQHPEFLIEKCDLSLECRGLSGSNLPDRPKATFNVYLPGKKDSSSIEDMKTFQPPSINFGNIKQKLKEGLMLLIFGILILYLYNLNSIVQTIQTTNKATRNSTNVVPVFSVKNLNGSNATTKQYIQFSTSEFNTETKHGHFDLATGLFTVKTAGIYQLNFNGHVRLWYIRTHHFELQVNDKRKAMSYTSSYSSEGYHQIDLSALLRLYIGDKVGIFQIEGQLHGEPESDFISTFSGILFSGRSA